MTNGEDEDAKPAGGEQPEAPAVATDEEEESLRELVRGVLKGSDPEAPDVLRGVQRKLRARSGGKFYADAWSTARHPPIAFYLLTSLLMLLIVLFVYLVLSPTSGAAVHVDNTIAPSGR
jgi:hypothetical protein